MRQSSNPVFRNMQKNHTGTYVESNTQSATWGGIIVKTLLLVLITIGAGASTWLLPMEVIIALIIVGAISSFFLVFFAMRFPKASMVLSIFYAVFQGILYGTLTYLVESLLPGVGLMALVGTFGIVAVMSILHAIGAVRATPFLVRFVMGALITILIGSLIIFILNIVNPTFVAGFANNYALMVIVYGFLVLLGAFMLIIDFDNAKQIVEMGAPKYYEWQTGLGILVTIVWIYLQLLRLLIIIMGNRR